MKKILLLSFFALFAPDSYRDLREAGCFIGCSSAFSAPLRETGCYIGCSSAFSAPLRETGCYINSSSPPSSLSDSLPPLNSSILSFVDSKMKKKVGRGECWDLAAEALNSAGAKWNGKFQFGRKLEKDEAFLPGDIIQFEGVKIKHEEGNVRFTQVMKHHTGIIYSLKGPKQFDMANQNTEEHGKKVTLSFIDLGNIVSGHYFIYRPVN